MTRYRRAKLFFNLELIAIEVSILLFVILVIEQLRPAC